MLAVPRRQERLAVTAIALDEQYARVFVFATLIGLSDTWVFGTTAGVAIGRLVVEGFGIES